MFLSWVSKGEGVSPSPSGEGAPPRIFFLNFTSRNGVLWCILGVIFYSSGDCCTHVIRLYIGTYIWFGNGNKL